ncbi:MAG: hypothetical protein HYZ79_00470 [Candidatus Melainabacteria bacterium]|nr:hypothetical protein [Candidatus Melainabacteria bacterium]
MKNKLLLKIFTPIGITIRTSSDYWVLIQKKHPEITNKLELIKSTLKMPDLITKSKADKSVLLFYRKINGYWLCVVAKYQETEGFIITSYITDKIKEGVKIWPS